MTDFKFWKPEHLGHAPLDWDRGPVLYRQYEEDSWKGVNYPSWSSGLEYKYLATIEDKNDAQFDIDAWLAQGHANLDAVQAKGVTLPDAPVVRDWATDAYVDILDLCGTPAFAAGARNGNPDTGDKDAIEYIRAHFQPREQPNG